MDLPDDEVSAKGSVNWPHAPPHRLASGGVYFVTSRTFNRVPHFNTRARLNLVRDRLLALAVRYGWQMEAWAVLSKHYHFVAHSPVSEKHARSLGLFVRHLHADITRTINREDGVEGRTLWHNYRETHLLQQHGYLARLNYTHNNPVHHKLVNLAGDYEWCSGSAFENACPRAWVNTIYSFKYDQISRKDEDDD